MQGAGWFKQDDGRLRYWDGARWTQHSCDPRSLPVGWYRRNDGLLVFWDGQHWSPAASRTGPRAQPSKEPSSSASALRLPLAAVAASVLVAVLLVVYAGASGGPSPAPPPPADTEALAPEAARYPARTDHGHEDDPQRRSRCRPGRNSGERTRAQDRL